MNVKKKILIGATLLLPLFSNAATVTADFEGSTTETSGATTAANLNAGTSGGTWSEPVVTDGSAYVTATDYTGMTSNCFYLGQSANSTTHASTVSFISDSVSLLDTGTTFSFDANLLGFGGGVGQIYFDIMNGSTVIARISMSPDAGGGRGILSHWNTTDTTSYGTGRTAIGGVDEDTIWTGAKAQTVTVTMTFSAGSFAVSTSGGGTDIDVSGLEYIAGHGQASYNRVRITASQNKAAVVLDNLTFDSTVATPAYGVEVTQEAGQLYWTVDYEEAVVSYKVQKEIDGNWQTIQTVAATGGANVSYQTVVGSGEFRVIAVDASGFEQAFGVSNETLQTEYLTLKSGWNLISVPVAKADLTAIKSATSGSIWGWNGTAYVAVEEIQPLQGLWIYSENTTELTISGEKVEDANVTLKSGWNLYGPAETCVAPEGLSIYTWDEAYSNLFDASATLIPGQGYWFYSADEKQINLR